MNKLEEELWAKMDEVINLEDDLDIFQIIKVIDDEKYIHDIDHDDMILGISGLDPDAVERVKNRREIFSKISKMEEEAKKRIEESLKKMIERRRQKASPLLFGPDEV